MEEIKVNDLQIYKFTNTNSKKPEFNKITAREFLKSKYNKNFCFGIENLKQYGVYKIMGWIIDFKPVMKKFIVKQYDSLFEAYAYNKTDLRNSIFGKINYTQKIKIE